MSIADFTEIEAWQQAEKLTLSIYQITDNINAYTYKDQIRRASISVMNNIAEGFGRRGDKEFIGFLNIARGSSYEVSSMIYLGNKLKYITNEKQRELIELCTSINKLINGFIRYLKKTNDQRPMTNTLTPYLHFSGILTGYLAHPLLKEEAAACFGCAVSLRYLLFNPMLTYVEYGGINFDC